MPPLPPPNNAVPQPTQPNDPPTAIDVENALRYSRNISVSHMSGTATTDNLADAAVYQLRVVQARKARAAGGVAEADAPPAWFAPAIQPLTDSVNQLLQVVHHVARTSAIAYNRQLGDGDALHIRFEVVRFPNGNDPTAYPHNLPALTSIQRVRGLSAAHSTSYFQGYYPHNEIPRTRNDRRPFILRAIGLMPTAI